MNLLSVKEIKQLLLEYETKLSKGLGQNFLIDKNVLEKIIGAGDIKPSDIILEVGPGIGTLTQELAKRAKRVIAVEKDKTMCEISKSTLSDFKNVKIIQGDILKIKPTDYSDPKGTPTTHYKLIANIPYYLTSPLIRKLLESDNPPSEIILMLQKEVAQRICSKPPNMSLLAVSVQFYAVPKIVSYVSKNCFWPSPKIDSAIIKITPFWQNRRPSILPRKEIKIKQVDAGLFFKIVKAGFSQPRKQLVNNLSKILKLKRSQTEKWLLHNKIDPKQRAETLLIQDWKNLSKSLPIFTNSANASC